MTIQSSAWPNEFPGAYWLDDKEEAAVLDVLRNGSMFRYYGVGDPQYADGSGRPRYVDAFEAAARSYYGCQYALGLNSGTGALITAMMALGIGPGCEVIVPSYMWVATVGAVVQCNAIPVLCEVDDTFTMNPDELAKKITPRTRLIIPIHMSGAPCDMDAIMALARKHDISVLEDCAQCNGGSYHGQKVGTFGDIGIFSLQLNKNMTSGEGGLLITNNEKLYQRAFASHDMGLIRVNGRLATPDRDVLSWGAGRRMVELCGAVASVQLSKLDDILNHMRGSKQRVKAQLAGTPGLAFRRLTDEAGDSGPFLILLLEDEGRALQAVERLKGAGIHNVFRIADYGLHIYSNIQPLVDKVPLSSTGNPWNLSENAESVYDYNQGACPDSDKLFARSVLVPIPSRLTGEQENRLAEAIRQALAGE